MGIDLRFFDMEFFTDERSSFQPKSSYEALRLIAENRNRIAHEGKTSGYKIITLMDSWYPFDFARRWVGHFDANFDILLYQGWETALIEKYHKIMFERESNPIGKP